MAKPTRKLESRKGQARGSNDSVIASRVLQDIINNSSDSFKRYMQQQGGGAAQSMIPTPEPLVGLRPGQQMPPQLWGHPGFAPDMQGPPAPATWVPPAGAIDRPTPNPMPWAAPVRMPQLSPAQGPTPATMPGGPIHFEDGSSRSPWETPRIPNMAPGSMQNILSILGLI